MSKPDSESTVLEKSFRCSTVEHLVILNFGSGDWETGFPAITAQIWQGNDPTSQAVTGPLQITGSLPGKPQLRDYYQRWQGLYEVLYGEDRDWQRRQTAVPEFEFDPAGITNVSSSEFCQLCQLLQQELNDWLNTKAFRPIDRELRTQLKPEVPLRIMIVAQDQSVLRLPWNLWEFLEDYPRAEIALSPPDYRRSLKSMAPKSPTVRILAILGNSQNIDINTDRHLLEALPDSELTLLIKPTWDTLSQHLWQANWDILFFAGHSSSQAQGYLQLNETEQITIEQLKYALKRSIEAGLQLAILNSCDGLGLAWALTDLQIPQVIVMREPVPDRVAQEFLKHFLTAFSNHQTLYLAVREAREKLQSLEAVYGCASWLPVIVQNPAEQPPTWRSLTQSPPTLAPTPPTRPRALAPPEPMDVNTSKTRQTSILPASSNAAGANSESESELDQPPSVPLRLKRAGFSALWVTALLLVLRWLGGLAPLELWTLDQLFRLRPKESPDPRLLVVTIDETDIQNQASPEQQVSLSDESLEKLLKTLTPASVIGLDLYRDFPVGDRQSSLVNQLKNQQIVGVCKGRDPVIDPTGIAPPPEMAKEQIGFSDFLTDADGVLRRQILSMTPDPASPCTTNYSFASQIVFNYLGQQGIRAKFTPKGNLQLGEQVFPRLRSRSGGYQPIDAHGNQILIHYRALDNPEAIAAQVSLSKVLRGELNPEAVRDRIVLIGVTAPSNGDFWATPYGSSTLEEVPGVFIHAQMVSQLLSRVLDGRPDLWVWPQWVDGLWILGWALAGGILVIAFRPRQSPQTPFQLMFWLGGAMLTVTALSFLLLLRGIWAPLIPAVIALPLAGAATAQGSTKSQTQNRSQPE